MPVYARTQERKTLFYDYVAKGDLENVSRFLHNEPKLSCVMRTNTKHSVIHEAAYQGNMPLLKTLVEHNDFHLWKKNSGGFLPLHLAAMRGHSVVVKYLFGLGPDFICVETDDSRTSLQLAIEGGFVNLVEEIILVLKTKQNSFGKDTMTSSLCVASLNGHIKIVKYLLSIPEIQSIINSKFNGNTALHASCMNDHCNVTNLLLKNKANYSITNLEGLRPIHIAAENNSILSLQVLIQAGEDPHVCSMGRQSPLRLSMASEAEDVYLYLTKTTEIQRRLTF
jgi:ankyrin repeat protein